MKYAKVLLIGLIMMITLCSCKENDNQSNANTTTSISQINADNKEIVIYQVNNGRVDADNFAFRIPKDYSVESTIEVFSIKDKSTGITISIEEYSSRDFELSSYIEMLRQQFSSFGISVFEEDEFDISGVKAKKISVKGLKSISENESMYCYFIPTSGDYVIASVCLAKDNKINLLEAENILGRIAIK